MQRTAPWSRRSHGRTPESAQRNAYRKRSHGDNARCPGRAMALQKPEG